MNNKSINKALCKTDIPSIRVGFVKVWNLLIKRNMFNSLQNGGRFINPPCFILI